MKSTWHTERTENVCCDRALKEKDEELPGVCDEEEGQGEGQEGGVYRATDSSGRHVASGPGRKIKGGWRRVPPCLPKSKTSQVRSKPHTTWTEKC